MAIKLNTVNQALLKVECTPNDILHASWGNATDIAGSIGLKAWQISNPSDAFKKIFNDYNGALAFAGGAYYKIVSGKKRYQNISIISTPTTDWSRDFNQFTFITKIVSTPSNNIQNADGIILYFWVLNR